MCRPAFPRFVHHAEGIGFCLVAIPKLMVTFQIPSRCFKCAVTRCLREMAVNLYLKAIRKFASESDAGRKASKPSVPLQPDAADKMRLNLVRRTK